MKTETTLEAQPGRDDDAVAGEGAADTAPSGTGLDDAAVDDAGPSDTGVDEASDDAAVEGSGRDYETEIRDLRKEAKRYRLANQKNEQALAKAQDHLTAVQTQLIEERLSRVLRNPKLFWKLGHEAADFITDTGEIDADALAAAAREAGREGLATSRGGSLEGGVRDTSTREKIDWASLTPAAMLGRQ